MKPRSTATPAKARPVVSRPPPLADQPASAGGAPSQPLRGQIADPTTLAVTGQPPIANRLPAAPTRPAPTARGEATSVKTSAPSAPTRPAKAVADASTTSGS